MSQDDVIHQIEFERGLKPGDTCLAYWTNSGAYHEAQVEVVAVNAKSFRVRIIKTANGYPVGTHLNIPSFLNTGRWSWNNRLVWTVRPGLKGG